MSERCHERAFGDVVVAEVYYRQTQFGFDYGAASVTRLCSDKNTKSVNLEVKTPRADIQVYVTKTGLIRVFGKDGKEWKP